MLILKNKVLHKKRISIILAIHFIIFGSFLMPASGQSFVKKDLEPPDVNITSPSFCSGTIATGTITIQGTAFDSSGINRVEAFARPILQNEDEFPFQLATPIAPGDWSKWSIQLSIPDDKPYWILVRAMDNFGNENWDETMINTERTRMNLAAVEDKSGQSRIAFVEPTFTNGAYNEDSFYFFYSKYQKVPEGQEITTDLNLMTGDIPFEVDVKYFQSIIDRVKQTLPNSIVSVIGDEEINDGFIFRKDGTNGYDLLVLLHNEYVTQSEYDNLKKFLNNGGAIILLTGNVFYAEILYDKEDCTVTLKKGHHWEFNGKSVRKSESERYLAENNKWFGSNFVDNDMKNKVVFERNPFNYKHFEENEVTNTKANILLDYKAKFPQIPSEKNPFVVGGLLKNKSDQEIKYSDEGKKIATYELSSGTGKVIQMGIYSQNLVTNKEFLNYFEKIILPRALSNTFQLDYENGKSDLYWILQGGKISDVTLDRESKTLIMKADLLARENTPQESYLTVVLPKMLLDAHTENKMTNFVVLVNGIVVPYEEASDDIERGLKVKISEDSEIKIIGTSAIPEFNVEYILPIMFVIFVTLGLFFKKTNFNISIIPIKI